MQSKRLQEDVKGGFFDQWIATIFWASIIKFILIFILFIKFTLNNIK